MRPNRIPVVTVAGLLLAFAGTLSACGSTSAGGAAASLRPSSPGQSPPRTTPPPDAAVVRLSIAFAPAALRLRTGQQFRLMVSKTIQASGPGVPHDCSPGAASQVSGGLLSLRCASSREYLYTAQRAGKAILSATVKPDCPPGTACPLWVTQASLKIIIS
jgi:hypothetical protein